MKYQDSHLDWTNGQTAQYIFSQCEGYLSMSSYYSNSFWFALAEQVDRRPRDTTQKQSLKCIFFFIQRSRAAYLLGKLFLHDYDMTCF